ncbi:uncharacterized protein G2W53_043421 [Senna tora]|uniref:Uncharacterized protein n=1 Tax=Senna tora TaxID=362788 RepID=A0A834SH11_9FABA|nr:uncharacterized protein G2W53_043421 [Senna tora]
MACRSDKDSVGEEDLIRSNVIKRFRNRSTRRA